MKWYDGYDMKMDAFDKWWVCDSIIDAYMCYGMMQMMLW